MVMFLNRFLRFQNKYGSVRIEALGFTAIALNVSEFLIQVTFYVMVSLFLLQLINSEVFSVGLSLYTLRRINSLQNCFNLKKKESRGKKENGVSANNNLTTDL